MADQVRRFCESLERDDGCQDWQVRQAEHAVRIYFVNFLQRTDWNHRPVSTVVDEDGRTNPLAALEQLRTRIRTRHYSYRTECSYADWVRRFLGYLAEREGIPRPCVDSESGAGPSSPEPVTGCPDAGDIEPLRRRCRRIELFLA